MEEIRSVCSKKEDSFSAGKEIGEKLADISPEFVFLFSSVKYDFNKLIKGVLSQTETIVSGGSSAGGICNDKIIEEGVVALGFNSEHLCFGSGIGTGISKNPVEAGVSSIQNAISSLKENKKKLIRIFARYYPVAINDPTHMIFERPNFAITTFIDGLSNSEESVLKGITQDFTTPLPLIGGSLADDLRLEKTFQICNNKVYKNSVVTTILVSDSRFGFSVSHGWSKMEETALVTKSKGRRVFELNNRPAVETYAEMLNLKPETLIKEKEIAFGTGLSHPLGAITLDGSYWLKHPQRVLEDGSITFFSTVPEGVALIATEGNPDDLIETGINTAKKTISMIDNVSALFVFNCIARKAFLGNRAEEEIKKIYELAEVPIIGFYTYGEQSFTSTTPISHRNQTISIMAIEGK